MAYDAGMKVGVEGNSEFKQAIKKINEELKTMDSALKLVESSFEGQMNSMEALTAKGKALQDLYDKQSEKVKTLTAAMQNAQNAEAQYANKANDLKTRLAAAQAEMDRLKNSTGDTSAEQKRLANEITSLTRELKAAERGQSKAASEVNRYQRELNLATVQLNKFENELKDNKRYLSEAQSATDKCAVSIDKYGKKTKEAADATTETVEQGNLLQKIFAGGFLANIATQAVNMLVNALKQLASAAVEAAGDLVRLNAETGVSIERLQEMQYVLTALDGSLETLERAQAKLTRSMDDARRGSEEYADAFARLGIEYKNADGSLRDATSVMYEAFDALGKIGSEADRDAIALRLFGRSAMELNPLIKAGSEEIKRLSEEAHTMGAVMSEETVQKLDTAADRVDMFNMSLKAKAGEAAAAVLDFFNKLFYGQEYAASQTELNVQSMADKIDELKSAYDSAYYSAKESLEKQMGLWDDMSQTATKSYSEIKNAVYSQIQWLQDYSTNLANLSSRNVEGIDKLVASLSDGSVQSAQILAGLATASDAELKSLVDRMADVKVYQDSLSRQLAQISTDTNKQLNELYGGVRNSAKELNASDVARQAAKDTMQGYIGEIKRWKDLVAEAFRQTAKTANDAYKDELKIKSPSRVAMETTENYFKGHIIKAKEMTSEMESAYSEPARKAQIAVQNVLPSALEEPRRDFADQAAVIGESISKTLANSTIAARGGVINLTVNLTGEIDGRQVMRATREYRIEEDELAGTSLIE